MITAEEMARALHKCMLTDEPHWFDYDNPTEVLYTARADFDMERVANLLNRLERIRARQWFRNPVDVIEGVLYDCKLDQEQVDKWRRYCEEDVIGDRVTVEFPDGTVFKGRLIPD